MIYDYYLASLDLNEDDKEFNNWKKKKREIT